MENIDQEIRELTQSINRMISGYSKIFPAVKTNFSPAGESGKELKNEQGVGTFREITGYFELMLGSTKGMLNNMGMMDSGFAKTVQLILQILSSIGGSGGAGFGGLFSGLLGVIGGLVGGPLGATLSGGLGSILGRSSAPLNSQINSHSSGGNSVINQVIIKNPVTFTKAFDVEVRTRNLRGGIDL